MHVADDSGVVLAETELREALELLDELERQSVEGAPESRPTPGQVVEQRALVEFAQGRVEVAKRRAAEAREAARQEALHAVGADLKAYADTDPAAGVRDALRGAVVAVQAYQAKVQGHEDAVADLNARTAALALPGRQPWGDPWEGQLAGGTYQGVTVSKFGDEARVALERALAGDVEGAAARLVAVKQPPQVTGYFRDSVGQFAPMAVFDGRMDRSLATMVRDGRAVPMNADEVKAWQSRKR